MRTSTQRLTLVKSMDHFHHQMNFVARLGLGLGLATGLLVTEAARAQGLLGGGEELVWEQVGDIPLDAGGLAFSGDGTLFAATSSAGLQRLVPGSATWEEVADEEGDHLLLLHPELPQPDTLLLGDGAIDWSIDGGETWQTIALGDALFATSLEGFNRGTLLTGNRTNDLASGASYSPDRGASWFLADFDEPGATRPREAVAFAELPAGHLHVGRLIYAGLGGIAYSDDAGRTWRPSANLWVNFGAQAEDVLVGPDGLLYAVAFDGTPGVFLWASADGVTWEERGALTNLGKLVVVKDPVEGTWALVHVSGNEDGGPGVYRSGDGGWTWELLGRVPQKTGIESARFVLIGPEGHLYVATNRAGPEEGWVYRTVTPLPVALEPGVLESPEDTRLRVYPNPSSGLLTVEGLPYMETAVVLDVRGREVVRLELSGGHGTIETAGLAPGVYLVRAGEQMARITLLK